MENPEQLLDIAFDEKMNLYEANAPEYNVNNVPAIVSYVGRIQSTLLNYMKD